MEEYLYGRIPVINALNGKRIPRKLLINKRSTDREVEKLAKTKGVEIEYVEPEVLKRISNNANTQGCLLYLSNFSYTSYEKVLKKVQNKEDSTILLLDSINDPVNFGSIIRSACFFSVDAIIIMKNRQVLVTPTVIKVATGAEEFVPICVVNNLTNAINDLKKIGYFIVSTSDKGDYLYDEIDYSGKIGLVIGNEGKGVSQLVMKNSDFIAKIPTSNSISSLNANVATACFLSMINSYRRKKIK